jgi:serine/threonine protein kinase
VVYRARQVTLDRDVAVKFLRDDQRTDPGLRDRFLQEARAVARLRHPHLVQLYEFGEVPAAGGATTRPYLVLEFVSGGSLADLLRGAPLPPLQAARLVEMLADAIHYAHQQGVVHRDLKPANVLLQRTEVTREEQTEVVYGPPPSPRSPIADLVPKVTDFGLAKLLAGGNLTHSGFVLGTPGYMAPEQATGKSEAVTTAVDVYGLGAILYETLTGRPPFAAATVDSTFGLVRMDEPVAPRRFQPAVPRDIGTICLKCLRKEPGRRYATARDLADDLRRFQAGEPVRARPVGTGEWVIVWCRRNPRVAALLAALVLVFLGGTAGVLWQWQHATRNAAQADRNAADYRHERDIARQEKDRAQHHLQMVRERVDRLNTLGRDLQLKPGQFRAGQAVLEQALAFYQDLLPKEGTDPRVRREAAQLYHRVGHIHHTLGQWGKAADAYAQERDLLASLVEEEPAGKDLRMRLADSHRWRANALRDLGRVPDALEAYDQAARLHEGLMLEFPDEPLYQMALANTLLNKANLYSRRDQAEELERLYRRVIELDRAAARAAPDDPRFREELALGLGDQGQFFMATGRGSQAELALREALTIQQGLLTDGHLKGSIERYQARTFDSLGHVLAAAGQVREAEQSYQEAVNLLDRLAGELPESGLRRADLAQTLADQADFLRDLGRWPEVEPIRQRVTRLYERLGTDFPEDPRHRRYLVRSYLEQVRLRCELGRPADAAELYHKAIDTETEDPSVNNELAWFLATGAKPPFRNGALAVRLAQKAVAARPQYSVFRNTLGAAHYCNGEYQAAVADLETAMA